MGRDVFVDANAATAVTSASSAVGAALASPANAGGRILGYSVRETAGAVAVVYLRDGTSSAGTPLSAGISLLANESIRDWFGPNGISVTTGVFVDRVSGTTEVTIFWLGN